MSDFVKTLIRIQDVQQCFKVGDEQIKVLHPSSFDIKARSFNIIFGPFVWVNQPCLMY